MRGDNFNYQGWGRDGYGRGRGKGDGVKTWGGGCSKSNNRGQHKIFPAKRVAPLVVIKKYTRIQLHYPLKFVAAIVWAYQKWSFINPLL